MPARLVRQDGFVKVWALLGSRDTVRIEAMLRLYEKLFPKYAHYVPRMRRRAEFGEERRTGHVVHYWLVEVDGRPAAIRTFRYVHNRRVGLAHALAVDPAYRQVTVDGQRLSMFLVDACLDQIVLDAKRFGDPPPLGMVNEVESSQLMEHYKRHGILELPVQYVEPVFPSERIGRTRQEEIALVNFSPMLLGFLPDVAAEIRIYTSELVSNFVLAFLVDHYGLPVDHPQVQSVLDSIPVLS